MSSETQIIYKFSLHPGIISHSLTAGAKVIAVQTQLNQPQMWVLLDPDAKPEMRNFHVFATGQLIYEKNLRYVGTYQVDAGALVFHVFEDTLY